MLQQREKCGAGVMAEDLHDGGKRAGLVEKQVRGIEETRTFGQVYFDAAVGAGEARLLNQRAYGKPLGLVRTKG